MVRIDFIKAAGHSLVRSYLFWFILVFAITAAVIITFVGRPQIGVIKIADISIDPWDAPKIVKMIEYARDTNAIKAVVVEIDSLGGGAVPSEEIYLSLVKLKKKKPVVAYINLWGLSGGYYIASAANFIYAKPTSLVGNIGVWSSLPPERQEPFENIASSGPYKRTTPRRDVINWTEMIKESFLRAVISQRGERLKISKAELSKARIYIGIEALRNGLIDEIGSSSDAIERAAELAGIRGYERLDINEELGLLPPWYELIAVSENRSYQAPESLKSPIDGLPMFHYRYGTR